MEAMFNTKNKNKGQVLVLVALSLVVFIGFAALAIDVAYFYHTRHQLQGAADAAALAGAAELSAPCDTVQISARAAAWRFACKNQAAGQKVYLATNIPSGCDDSLTGVDLNNSNSISGDIVLGHWTGSIVDPNGTPVDAVQVTARRTGAFDGMPKVSTFFGKIFGVDAVNISATAVAAKNVSPPILPIAVNEYWLALGNDNLRPYDDSVHAYPNSFVRKTNVNGTNSEAWDHDQDQGKTFAILGAFANSNSDPNNTASYVYLDSRSNHHSGGSYWHDIIDGNPSNAQSCSNCSNGFFNGTTLHNQGYVDSKKGDSLKHLFNGYTSNYLIPTAVVEQYRDPGPYPGSNYLDPTSQCPYATVPYFSTSGGYPVTNSSYQGKSFADVYHKGDKVIALVYDGTYITPVSNAPNSVTIVGYVLLEIDGYGTNPRNRDSDDSGNIEQGELNDSQGNTVYAHALAPIVEPDETISDPNERCESFFTEIRQVGCQASLEFRGARARLVQ